MRSCASDNLFCRAHKDVNVLLAAIYPCSLHTQILSSALKHAPS